VLERREEIERILERIPQPGADPATLAFFLVGCVSLDWDGLNLTVEKGYRTEPGYLPEAREPGGGGSRRGLYWGSHNMHLPTALTTFGDHDAGRYGFPDLLWRMGRELNGIEAPEALKPRISDVVDAWHDALLRQVGSIMLHLREGDRTGEELAQAAGLSKREADTLLALLVELEYVREVADDRFRAEIPVLTERDAAAAADLRRVGRDIMETWLADREDSLEQALADLTAVSHGVPLADGFYWIWHYLFAIANRELVAAGFFADPYAPDRKFKGYIPAVYRLSVVMGPLDVEEQ
jgi:DNA-binding MarR family transcriptional regulator